jgi:glucosamine--fructose-6-phosphate aminotransferase (isomerizing)
MCGIVGYIGKKTNAIETIISGLEALEYRGYDSAGIAYLTENQVNIIKKQGRIENLKNELDFNTNSNLGIGHTRWATHGEPNEVNAHPHKCGKFTIVHNGIIENYAELRNELEQKGYSFKSQTDTEVACATIDSIYKENHDILKTLQQASKVLEGSYAIGLICDDDINTMYAIRLSSPLIVAIKDDDKFIASDVPAILNYTNEYFLLDDGDIVELKQDSLKFYNKNLELVNKEKLLFEGNMEAGKKDGFEHFMLKEINEEPKVIHNTIKFYFDGTKESLNKNIPDLSKYKDIHIVACGSAYHTGLVAKTLIEEIANIPVMCEIASEYRYKKVFYNKETLVIVISQSGETADTLASLRKAKEDGIDTLAIVNVIGSSIAREADNTLYIKAGCEIAVATTKAYSAQVALLSLIALKLAIIHNKITDDEFNLISEQITKLPTMIKELINSNQYKEVATKIHMRDDIFYLGRKIDYAMSMEGSLKLKEISYINCVAYAAGELKHGTISLVEENTPVIAVITDDDIKAKTISNLKETKARGAYVILISNFEETDNYFNDNIIIPNIHQLLQPIITIVPLQLLAYEIAKLKGCDIDKPRNLAKSVTVE